MRFTVTGHAMVGERHEPVIGPGGDLITLISWDPDRSVAMFEVIAPTGLAAVNEVAQCVDLWFVRMGVEQL